MGFLAVPGLGLMDVLMIGVVGSLLRNSLISLSSPGEFSTSLSLSAELTSDTIVTTSLVLGSMKAFPRPPRSSSLLGPDEARKRLFALLDRLFKGADLIDRSSRDIWRTVRAVDLYLCSYPTDFFSFLHRLFTFKLFYH